jgi:MOSC domain-containing protein YiiM/ferredoxin-NADP reductase
MRTLSVNLGGSREISIKHRPVQTSIYKAPVSGRVAVHRLGLAGDARIEPRKMGLEHHAVYAYPYEHYAHWQRELDHAPFPMGQFGENLTVTGLLEDEVRIGDVLRIGSAVLQVAHPRIPCAKLNERMGLHFSSMFMASRKVGFYLRVLQEGDVGANDPIELLERDPASPTVEAFVRITHYEYWDAQGLQHLLQARDLMPAWRETIEAKLARALTADGWAGLREFEVVRKEVECEDTVSLYLQCIRGRPLAPFHGGQQLTVVLGGRSAHQQRRAYAISSNPGDRSTYRITVRRMAAPDHDQPEGIVSSRLVALNVGEHVLCTAPHGACAPNPPPRSGRIPVLLSQGLGIAPMLSVFYELDSHQAPTAWLFHESGGADPQGLLREACAIAGRHPGFHMNKAGTGLPDRLDGERIGRHVPLEQADFYIAGSSRFVGRVVDELEAAALAPSILMAQRFG